MTMPRGASRALYAGNGQAVKFPFFFKVFEEDQLSVLVTSPAGVTSEAAGWTAELDDGGGTVSYLHNGAALPEGWKLAIMRDMPFVQEVDLITGTRFDPEVIETALDVATAERQQLLERLDRAIVVEPTDEGGPEALLADIRDARTSSAASATSAKASANAAAASAQSAAGSAAIATEQREAACICAGEAIAARDAAIAQTEAANILMETELGKVNAIVAANKTDQQAAVTAARQWAEKAPDVPVDYDEDGKPRYSALHWADRAQKLAINPDGETVTVDADGILRALGGNLLLNAEEWIAASGEWVAKVTGWHEIHVWHGGDGAVWGTANNNGHAGGGYAPLRYMAYYAAGEAVAVSIGAGGIGTVGPTSSGHSGGLTTFGALPTVEDAYKARIPPAAYLKAGCTSSTGTFLSGMGAGAGNFGSTPQPGKFYGAGGGLKGDSTAANAVAANGCQGAVLARWHDPAKAAGPQPAPMLLSVRRMAVRAADAPATVNLYDPETGQGSVWREEDAEAKLAEGLITEAAWLAIRAERAAGAHAAWLADPETEPERFELLRQARDAKLAATDYLVAPDYPLTDEQRAAATAWRQALRDLPAQEGAPWDGGGELTPWPVMPAGQTAAEAPCV